MRIKRKLVAGIGVLALIGVALWMRALASWRPVLLMKVDSHQRIPTLEISPDGRFLRTGPRSIYDLEAQKWAPRVPGSENFYSFAPGETYLTAHYYFSRPDSPHQNFPSGAKILRRKTATGKVMWRAIDHHLENNDVIRALTLSDDGQEVLLWVGTGVKAFGITSGKVRWKRALAPFDKSKFAFNVAMRGNRLWSADEPEELVADVKVGRILWRRPTNSWMYGDGISPDGKWIWRALGEEGTPISMRIYDAKTGETKWKHDTGASWDDGVAPAFSGDGRLMALLDYKGVKWFDVKSGALVGQRLGPSRRKAVVVALSHKGDWLYTLDKLGQIWRFRLR